MALLFLDSGFCVPADKSSAAHFRVLASFKFFGASEQRAKAFFREGGIHYDFFLLLLFLLSRSCLWPRFFRFQWVLRKFLFSFFFFFPSFLFRKQTLTRRKYMRKVFIGFFENTFTTVFPSKIVNFATARNRRWRRWFGKRKWSALSIIQWE